MIDPAGGQKHDVCLRMYVFFLLSFNGCFFRRGRTFGGQLPADKKKGGKSKGKGKAKGKGKSVTSSAAGAGGEAGGTSSDIPRAQDALSALGAEVTGLLRGLVTALKVGSASGRKYWCLCAQR